MSNVLTFPLRVYDEDPQDITLMVLHENTSWAQTREQSNATRKFCNWIRKQFPNLPSEFRYVSKKGVYVRRGWYSRRIKTVNSDKHFVVYGLTANQLLLIKLSWTFTTQPVVLKDGGHYPEGSYQLEKIPTPTEALIKRMEQPRKAKTLGDL